jgi:sarcosine oxidase
MSATSRSYDVIVLGVGAMGSAACATLARRGLRVLGLEQFPLLHSRGSSSGHTRIIRTAYFEHPDYVPLLHRAWEGWFALERYVARHLVTICPCMSLGRADSEIVLGVRRAAEEHHLRLDDLSAAEITRRVPAFRSVPEEYRGVVEFRSGFLYLEACIRSHLEVAEAHGAELHAEEPVLEWRQARGGVEVVTERGTYSAEKLVVTAGAWATRLLADIGVPLTVMRQVMLWCDVSGHEAELGRGGFPIFGADVPGGPFYGIPAIDRWGMKVARHYGAPELAGPEQMSWEVTEADHAPAQAFLGEWFPRLSGRITRSQACMYTLTPDRHFVIDLHPTQQNVVIACGFSGHGFKFVPVVGEALADLVQHGRSELPISMFSARRFASRLAAATPQPT